MAGWELKITHIDLLTTGDATLLVARYRNAAGAVTQRRSLLIDGGRAGRMINVDHLVRTVEGLAALDVIVVTHYDQDHYGGITALLGTGHAAYANCRIYDQGEASTVGVRNRRVSGGGRVAEAEVGRRESQYDNYVSAIEALPGCTRVTEQVCSFHDTNADPGLAALGWQDRSWLIGRELLWDGMPYPANAPRVTCVAANQFVRQNGGAPPRLLSASALATEDRRKNQKSLALLVEFGNFRYYAGGDLESAQEDDATYGLKRHLNPTNDVAGRIHAFKTSHHGSKFSTAAGFLSRIRGRVAFISNGTNNQFGHPDQPVIDRLEANGSIEKYFLTGEQYGRAFAGKAEVCGVWPPGPGLPTQYGDVTLSLNQAEGAANPPQFHVRYHQPNAGNNPYTGPFAYTPHSLWVEHF